jgi:hypothetical protein
LPTPPAQLAAYTGETSTVPLLQAEIESVTGADGAVAPGVVTVRLDETAHEVSDPVTTSEYWKVNSAFWVGVTVTSAAGCEAGPDWFTVSPCTNVVTTAAPLELNRVRLGYPSMVQVPVPTSLKVMVPMMVPAAPWILPGVALTWAQAAMPVVVVVLAVVGGAAVVVVVRWTVVVVVVG